MAKAISETHEMGKYPVQEKEEKRNHLGLKIGLGVGIPTAIIGGFFGYKALTNNNQVSTEEVQRALIPQDKKVEVVKKDYGQEAVKDLKDNMKPADADLSAKLPFYLDFAKEDYAIIINNSVNTDPDIEPSQIYKAKKISKDYLDRLARYANKFLNLTTAETGKKLIKGWGFEPGSGHLVYVRTNDGIESYLFFRKKDTGELKYFLTTPPSGSLVY